MRILLIGEFSRLHTSLKEGLTVLGHEVTTISNGDGMKRYPADISFASTIKQYWFFNKLNNIAIRFLKINFIQLEHVFRFKKALPLLKNYDVVQFINEDFLFAKPQHQIQILNTLKTQNKKLFLLCCGEDYRTIHYYLNQKEGYSILTPYLKNKTLFKKFNYSLKYVTSPYFELHKALQKNISGTIASDMDYHIPLKADNDYLGLIPNPINTSLLSSNDIKPSKKINIFLGINTHSDVKKGIHYFEKALKIIQENHSNKVSIQITKNLPYKEYIEVYNNAHILLDQVFSYDQGYNALEAMGKGKVVFTGAEKEWLDYYNLNEDTVAINALPDVDYLVKKLEWLILNPEMILKIATNAKRFIEKEHNYITIAKKYTATWSSK